MVRAGFSARTFSPPPEKNAARTVEYGARVANPFVAAERGYIDDVILPRIPVWTVPALFRWCLERGLKGVMPMTLMTIGEYRTPGGAYVPSVLY